MLVTLACEIFSGGSDIDDPGVSLGINELQDSFEIILDGGGSCPGRIEIFLPGTPSKIGTHEK